MDNTNNKEHKITEVNGQLGLHSNWMHGSSAPLGRGKENSDTMNKSILIVPDGYTVSIHLIMMTTMNVCSKAFNPTFPSLPCLLK